MEYWSQLEVEKLLEWVLARQEARVPSEERENNEALMELREILVLFKESNFEALDIEMGMSEIFKT